MGVQVLLLALTLFPATAAASLEPHYVVVFPAVIHHSREEKLCVHLRSLPEAVHLTVTLEMEAQNHTLVEQNVEKPGTFECISFQVSVAVIAGLAENALAFTSDRSPARLQEHYPSLLINLFSISLSEPIQIPEFIPKKTDDSTSHTEEVGFMHALIHSGDSVLFEGRKKVLVKPKKDVILVETDKAFYKPGETVKFRIVNLDDDLNVIKNSYSQIWLEDPEHNRIAEWQNVKSKHGIVDLSFPLASEAAIGQYTISVRGRIEKRFRVEEYELMKFEMKLEHPPFITTVDEEFEVKVCGKYTYGKPVQGNISVSFILSSHSEDETSNSSEKKEHSSSTNKNGCATFTMKTQTLELTEHDSYISVKGAIEEDGTGIMTNKTAKIPIVTRMKSVEFIDLHPFYKRGLPYTGKLYCHSGDSPLINETVYLTVDINDEEIQLSFLTDEKGEVHFSLDTTSWNSTMVSLKGTYFIANDTEKNHFDSSKKIEESLYWLKPFYSESNSFLEIQDRNDIFLCDQEQEVQVDYILDHNKLSSEVDDVDFYYLVIAKGKILFSGEKQVPILQHENLKGSFSLILTIGYDFLPDIKLLVYTIFSDGEVVADAQGFEVAKCLRHKVTLNFSQKEEVPRSEVTLNLKAAPGSLCSVQAVDRSILLLENHTLTATTLYKKFFDDNFIIGTRGFPYHLEDFEAYPCLNLQSDPQKKKISMAAPWYQSDADVFNLFKLLRMKILTNTKIKKPVHCMQPGFTKKMYYSRGNIVNVTAFHDGHVPHPDNTEKPKPRTYFPETWIWDLVSVGEEGKASLQVIVPDTITEWNANTFCVAESGFGLSPLTFLTVFKPFFVDLTLPYSVVQGETFSLKATVFNYLKTCIQVHTTLTETSELKVVPCSDCQFTSCLCANEAKTFVWNVTATKLGKVNVTVNSVAQDAHNQCDNRITVTPLRGEMDTVIKLLLVKPGGVLQENTQNAFLCATENTVSHEFSLTLPEEVLEGSGRATLSVIGDIMGPALQNLDQLLQMPFGCGEQNMVKFAPNIFILQYLKKIKHLVPEIEDKALKFLKTGYQRQLLYKHHDGSYSAFGKADTQGNTWLTAFVARSFGQASSHIYINKHHVEDALLWLQKHQLPSGCFQSVGKLFNNDLKGGVDDSLSLTAYITAALLELHLEKNDTMLDNALRCLKDVALNETSLYVKALMAYVFTLTKNMEMREQLLDELQKEIAGLLSSHSSGRESSSSMIEIVAYTLLAHVSKPNVAVNETTMSRLVHWLSGRRNAFGGFASTQDTVVSLQALAQYAALIPHEIRDVKVMVKGKDASPVEFHVHRNNKFVLHQAPLLAIPGVYTVQATGSGCVYVQTTLYYNTPPSKAKEAFVLDVETVPKSCDNGKEQLDIHVSVSYVGDRETSNMALVEVEMLSGFIPMKSSIKALEEISLVKKTEIKPDKVTIYLEELDKTSVKLTISVEQDIEVQNLKPATVHVYDYYKPDDHTAREYLSPCRSDV
ncbi:PREDICTED: alpha-2-macroglobulin-like protein 1 [Tinamus guttatus]|uniref:alpha-2-macroglobulin-like protein 1 n=1 Tax=Tinamus guttatus TaxID=94827 RepID=UPI00052EC32B|nr:PREDICTED: alpha-2-macroglobulin-like protein 1 [Tinamus guttatus]